MVLDDALKRVFLVRDPALGFVLTPANLAICPKLETELVLI